MVSGIRYRCTPAALTTFSHVAISLRMKLSNSAGVLPMSSPPLFASASRTSALRSAATLPLVARGLYRDPAHDYDVCDIRGKICF